MVERFGNNPELLSAQVQRATRLPFYNTSPWTLKTLLGDPKGIEANLKHYVNGFSDNMDVFERFKLADEIATMAEKNILYIVVERFSNIDLHPKTVTNAEMGDLYEYSTSSARSTSPPTRRQVSTSPRATPSDSSWISSLLATTKR